MIRSWPAGSMRVGRNWPVSNTSWPKQCSSDHCCQSRPSPKLMMHFPLFPISPSFQNNSESGENCPNFSQFNISSAKISDDFSYSHPLRIFNFPLFSQKRTFPLFQNFILWFRWFFLFLHALYIDFRFPLLLTWWIFAHAMHIGLLDAPDCCYRPILDRPYNCRVCKNKTFWRMKIFKKIRRG